MKKLVHSALTSALLLLTLQAPAMAAPTEGQSSSGIDLTALDRSVSPSNDFYSFANGGWLKRNPIPSDKPRWGHFNMLAERNQDTLRDILRRGAATGNINNPQTDDDRLGLLYSQGLDEKTLATQSAKPLQDDLKTIAAISSSSELQSQVVKMHRRGLPAFFAFGSSQDAKNSRKIIAEFRQSGLGLPESQYYTRTDEKSVKQRAAYQTHLFDVFRKIGYSSNDARSKAEQVFQLEERLAKASLTNVQLRDPEATYHPLSRSQWVTFSNSAWDWDGYLKAVGLSDSAQEFNNATPRFFEELSQVWLDTPLPVLKSYLEWNLVRGSYDYLSEDWSNFRFAFYGKTLTGTPAQLPRWRRVVKIVDTNLGEALGKRYVEETFPPQAKARVKEMVELIKEAMREDLDQLSWMTPETKKKAQEKLSSFHAKIGYPDKMRNYNDLNLRDDSFIQNLWRCQEHEFQRDLAKVGTAPNPNDWYMTPPTVNAYYDPQMNEIVFPAGIMQFPFFSLDSDDALNFGGIGAVIGHEITHGFDDQGRQYDGRGNLQNWWSPDDLSRFNVLAEKVEKQFSGYKVADDLNINGKLVLGESIADLGGLRLSYLAYQKWLKKHPSKVMDGFSPDQRFFLGYARIWAINMRPEYERLQVNTDPHPHAKYRVNGPLSNMPEFAKAFKLPNDCQMVRKDRILLW